LALNAAAKRARAGSGKRARQLLANFASAWQRASSRATRGPWSRQQAAQIPRSNDESKPQERHVSGAGIPYALAELEIDGQILELSNWQNRKNQ